MVSSEEYQDAATRWEELGQEIDDLIFENMHGDTAGEHGEEILSLKYDRELQAAIMQDYHNKDTNEDNDSYW